MFLKNIFKVISRHIDFKTHKPPVLGRWCLHHESVAHRKADKDLWDKVNKSKQQKKNN